jgi:hypothetical protein
LQEIEALVREEGKAFETNVEKWKSAKKSEATKQLIGSIVRIGIDIASTVATCGVAGPLLLKSGSELLSKTGEVVKLWDKVKVVIAELKKIYELLKPAMEAIGKLIDKAKAAEALFKGLDPNVPSQNFEKADMKLGALNAIAQWSEFNVQIDALEKSLASCDIPDKDKYFLAMKKLVIRGQTFIQAQTELIRCGDELAVTTLRLKQEDRARPALENMSKHFKDDVNTTQMLKIAMFDRLLAVRALVFVDLYSYANAYMFHSLDTWVPISLSPTKPIVDYLNDAAKLQSAVVAFGSRACVQRKVFTIPYSTDHATQLLAQLCTEGSFDLQISPDDGAFEGVCRVRLSQARFRFHGAKVNESEAASRRPLRLVLSTSKEFYDICFPGPVPTSTLIRSFVGDERRVTFEQELDQGRILCDGDFGLKSDYLMLTPFTQWTVQVAKGGVLAKDIDAASISGASLELTCEVCFLP